MTSFNRPGTKILTDKIAKNTYFVNSNRYSMRLGTTYSNMCCSSVVEELVLRISKMRQESCASDGRVVTSNTRYLQFESSYQQNFIMNLFSVKC